MGKGSSIIGNKKGETETYPLFEEEIGEILNGTRQKVEEFIESEDAQYITIIKKCKRRGGE